MASSSSSLTLSCPSSSLSQNWEHDVFPSFHGPDVRKTFFSHIRKEFRSKGINLFIDNEIKRGEFIGPELKRAIRGSKIAVVLLSRNYASSSWCLDELVEIMKKELGQMVMTIFYEVDPTDIKKQTGDFGNAFKETCQGKTEENIETWRKALESVATIAGYHSSNWVDEAAMIENIADDISKMLNHLTPSSDFDHFIGMQYHMERMNLLLGLDSDEVRMIGIWGPSGIGKTTIASFLFNQVSSRFQNSAIMMNIKGSYPRPCLDERSAQLQLQNQMLSQMINLKDDMIPHLGVAQGRLRDKKVFLVLDDVDRLAQLNALAKDVKWFGPRSRIIITSEDLRLLKAHGINHIYTVNFPSTDEALQIFCMYTFDQKSPKDGFETLAHEVTYLVGELPLALKVMGSYFRGLSKEQWSMELPRLRTTLNGEIESILKFSYDALYDEDKDLFLHIACFFNYNYIEKVEEHLAESFKNVRHRLHTLVEKSLISINSFNHIEMHKLLVQLGKEIVRKQSVREPGQRQFLVDDKDICEVLTDYTTVTKSIIGIKSYRLNITEKAFDGMSNLQFLSVKHGYDHPNIIPSPGPLNLISQKLRLLHWSWFPLTCLPFIINLEFLVELRMDHSKLEKLWDGVKRLGNLRWINLSNSTNLKLLPDLSKAINLKELDLNGCSSLVKLPSSIEHATNLKKLDFSGCSSLLKLPSSIGKLTHLEKLHLSRCSSLVELPSFIENATSFQQLDLRECSSLVELPFSIGNLTHLRKLYLSGCSSLTELPSSIVNISFLDELDLSGCSSLVKLPSSIGNANNLYKLVLRGCSKLKNLPTAINMESLNSLDLTDCCSLKRFPEISTSIVFLNLLGTSIKEVPLSVRLWSHLKDLRIPYNENLKEFQYIHNTITELHLRDTEIQELGQWVRGLSRLNRLVLKGMKRLVSLPHLPDSLRLLDAENCESLEKLHCSFCNPRIRLDFRNCFKLNPEAIDHIIQTSTLEFVILPGREVPACFTYKAYGNSIIMKLNQNHLHTSTKFKACVLFVNKGENEAPHWEHMSVSCSITSKKNALTASRSYDRNLYPILMEHLYIFDYAPEEVTSTELVFTFECISYSFPKTWEIKECGILSTFGASC